MLRDWISERKLKHVDPWSGSQQVEDGAHAAQP